MLPCPYKHFLGIDCPGCGMQRSIIELLNGNIISSIQIYPPLIPMILLLLFLILHLKFKFKRGAKSIKYFFIFVVIIVIINYTLKFFT